MTDTIKFELSLAKLPIEERLKARALRKTKRQAEDHPVSDFNSQFSITSPMSGSTIMLYIWTREEPAYGPVPYKIETEMHVPNALCGHNVLIGTSVHAAATAACKILLILLAGCGLAERSIRQLTTADVTLLEVTITYLMHYASNLDGIQAERAFYEAVKLLRRLRFSAHESKNRSTYYREPLFKIVGYPKSRFNHCKWQENPLEDTIKQEAEKVYRIEAQLRSRFLENRALTTIASWRDAYENGLYKEFFDLTVGDALHFKEATLRHKAPRDEVYAKLPPTAADLLRWHIHGNDVASFPAIANNRYPIKEKSRLGHMIRTVARVHINMPWTDHQELRHADLKELIQYPGDFHPEAHLAPSCFCKSSWPTWEQRLDEKLQHTLDTKLALAA